MSQEKKRIRSEFSCAVFERDGYNCRVCGGSSVIDPHHIMNRNAFLNGGYVVENGITLCSECHKKAEAWSYFGGDDTYCPTNLFEKIGSSLEEAFEADERRA